MTREYKGYLIDVTDLMTGYESDIAFDAIYENDQYLSNSCQNIHVSKDDITIVNILLKGSGGATSVYENSFVIISDTLITRSSNTVYAFTLPNLKLKWKKVLDIATCIQILNFKEDVLVHGECAITLITLDGNIKWQFEARDIFVNMNGYNEFEIVDDKIKLVDFQNYEYIVDENGQMVSERLLR